MGWGDPVHTSNSLLSLSRFYWCACSVWYSISTELGVKGRGDPVHTSNSLFSVSLCLLLCLFNMVLEEFSRVRCEGMG